MLQSPRRATQWRKLIVETDQVQRPNRYPPPLLFVPSGPWNPRVRAPCLSVAFPPLCPLRRRPSHARPHAPVDARNNRTLNRLVQTIGSMRHQAVFEDILKAVSAKKNPRPNPSPTRPPLTPATVPPTPGGSEESAAPSGYGVRSRPPASASSPIGRAPPRGPTGVSRDVSRIFESPSGETGRWGYRESAALGTPLRAPRQPRTAPRTAPRSGLRDVPPRASAVASSTTNGEAHQHQQHHRDHEQSSTLSVRRHRLSTPRNSGQRREAMQAAVDGFGVEANDRLQMFASNSGDAAAVVAREAQHAQQHDRRPVSMSRSVSPSPQQTTNTAAAGKVVPRESAYSSSGGAGYTGDGGRFSNGGGGYGSDDGRREHKEQHAHHDRQQAQQQVAPAHGVSGRVSGPVTHRRLWPFGLSNGGTESFADDASQSKDSTYSNGRDVSAGRSAVGVATAHQRRSTLDAGGPATAGYGRTARPLETGITGRAGVGYGRATSGVDADSNNGRDAGYRTGSSGAGVPSDELRRRRRTTDYRRRSSPPPPHHHQQHKHRGEDGGIWSKRSSSPNPALREGEPVEVGARPNSTPPFTRGGDDAGDDGAVIRIRGGGLGQAGRRPVSMRWSLATNGVGTYAEPVQSNGARGGGNRLMSEDMKLDDME